MDAKLLKHQFSHVFLEMINLKYSSLVSMIQELNSIAEYFIDDDGSSLSFCICKGTDQTFLWKLTIRIECLKLNHNELKSSRVLRLNQFVNIYNHIKQQSEILKSFQAKQQSTQNITNQNNTLDNTESEKVNRLYDTIQSLSMNNSACCSDDDICCICMETKSNLILSCTHNYCEKCIQEWQVTSDTCPICRCYAGKNDGFVLADYRPDYYCLQEELSKSLFKITDDKTSYTHRQATTDTSDEQSD